MMPVGLKVDIWWLLLVAVRGVLLLWPFASVGTTDDCVMLAP